MWSTTPFATISTTGRPSRSSGPRRSSSISPPPARAEGGFRAFSAAADQRDHHGRGRVQAQRQDRRRRHRLCRSRQEARRAAPLRPGHPRRPAVDGQDRRSPPTSPSTPPRPTARAAAADGRAVAEDGAVVGFFSLEMSAEQLATRILAEESGVSSDRIRRGDVSHEDFDRFVAGEPAPRSRCRCSSTTPRRSASRRLRTRARRLKRQQGLGLIVVDYLQLLRALGRRCAAWKTGCRKSPRSPAA